MLLLAASSTPDATTIFIEIGVISLGLAVLARMTSRLGISAVPLYLVAGLALGNGGLIEFDSATDFISTTAEIGVLLLLLSLGLEYTGNELRSGLRTGAVTGAVDAVFNFTPGFLLGVIMGWTIPASVLLGGVTWTSSSGVISKVLTDLNRLGNRETPAVLNLLVIEDLAMALYLPIIAAVLAGEGATRTVLAVAVAVITVAVVLWAAMSWGHLVGIALGPSNNEALILSVIGMTLLAGGLLQKIQVSAAIGAFLVGLSISGPVQERASQLVEPMRDVFAAIFFLFFAIQIDPSELPSALPPAILLFLLTAAAKLVTGWIAAKRIGAAPKGRIRAGTALIARGEFSIVIAALGAELVNGPQLGSTAAAYVLLTAILGPVAAKNADAVASLFDRSNRSTTSG